jgi:hypothetical protein
MTDKRVNNAPIDVRRTAILGAVVVASSLAVYMTGLPFDVRSRTAAILFVVPTVAALVVAASGCGASMVTSSSARDRPAATAGLKETPGVGPHSTSSSYACLATRKESL